MHITFIMLKKFFLLQLIRDIFDSISFNFEFNNDSFDIKITKKMLIIINQNYLFYDFMTKIGKDV